MEIMEIIMGRHQSPREPRKIMGTEVETAMGMGMGMGVETGMEAGMETVMEGATEMGIIIGLRMRKRRKTIPVRKNPTDRYKQEPPGNYHHRRFLFHDSEVTLT